MNERTIAAPRNKGSRSVAIFAGLWVLAVSTGQRINATLLLTEIFAILTLASVGYLIVTDTKAAGRRLAYPTVLYLVVWFFWLLTAALAPLWENVLALSFTPSR